MRRIVCIFSLCLVLSACDAGSGDLYPDPAVVDFGVSYTTREAVDSEEDITTLGMFGYITGARRFKPEDNSLIPNLFFDNRAVRVGNGSWDYSPLVYWPTDPTIKHSFLAYSPHSSQFPKGSLALSKPTKGGNPQLRYTVPAEVSRQVDILYSGAVANLNGATYDGRVPFRMGHALARVEFLAAPVSVSEGSSSVVYALKAMSLAAQNAVGTSSLDVGTGEWSDGDSTSVEYSFDVNREPIAAGETARATARGNELLLIPQSLGGEVNSATVNISYLLYDGTGKWQEHSFSVPFPDVKLTAGSMQTYLLRLSPDGVQIEMDETASVEK